MFLIVAGLILLFTGPVALALVACYIQARVYYLYLPRVARIFQEKPIFIVPRGQPRDDAESVRFPTENGLSLNGCYFRASAPRRGVILFGLEFGSNCWSAWQYCEHLVSAGFDVFAFECRNQGESDCEPGYEPLQWVTNHEVTDARAALLYLRGRPDADPRGVGLFGISKGAGACLIAASQDPYVVCAVTDGMFATSTTLIPYMRQWVKIYNARFPTVLLPDWYYHFVAWITLRKVERQRRCRFPSLERVLARFRKPLLMIHGGQDSYIRPEMARALFERAAEPREFWLVEKAKHNQALHLEGEKYRERVLRFFEQHLAKAPLPQGERRNSKRSLPHRAACLL